MGQEINKEYYFELLAKHGPTYAAVDAGSEQTHRTRLEVLSAMVRDNRSSILDVGCGLGHLIDYGHGMRKTDYLGIDTLDPMIAAARARRPGWKFEQGDIMKPKSIWSADYVLASGLFQFSHLDAIQQALTIMYGLCRKGMAANFLRLGEPEECVLNPTAIIRVAMALTTWWTLRADYLPNDFTVYLYKEKRC